MNLTKEEQDRPNYKIGDKIRTLCNGNFYNHNAVLADREYTVMGLCEDGVFIDGSVPYKGLDPGWLMFFDEIQWAEILPNESEQTKPEIVEFLKSEITRLESELKEKTELINKVLNLSVEQIYFNDSADYLTAHYEIVHKIRPDLGDLDEDIIKEIYHGLKQ